MRLDTFMRIMALLANYPQASRDAAARRFIRRQQAAKKRAAAR